MAKRLVVALACCLVTGIPVFAQQATSPPPSEIDILRGNLERLSAELGRAIGDPLAGSLSACASVAVGAKACGGPTHYRAYSTETADVARVTTLAAEYTRTERRLNELTGAISDCMVVTPPTLALANGRCVAAAPGVGPAPATRFSPASSR